MENGVYTYGELKEQLKNEKIKLEFCGNTVLEVNGLIFATVNKIEIYKMMISGEKIPEDVMKLYKKYNGPLPNGFK